jgi:hypothetical protein
MAYLKALQSLVQLKKASNLRKWTVNNKDICFIKAGQCFSKSLG